MTDFENAAFTVFSVLATRVVLAFDLALYIPLSKVDENMARAARIDAVRTEKFYFRRNIESLPCPVPVRVSESISCDSAGGNLPQPGTLACAIATAAGFPCALSSDRPGEQPQSTASPEVLEALYEEMTMNEIFNGKGCYFPGKSKYKHAILDVLLNYF